MRNVPVVGAATFTDASMRTTAPTSGSRLSVVMLPSGFICWLLRNASHTQSAPFVSSHWPFAMFNAVFVGAPASVGPVVVMPVSQNDGSVLLNGSHAATTGRGVAKFVIAPSVPSRRPVIITDQLLPLVRLCADTASPLPET